MVETQYDRIENMLKVLIRANGVDLTGDDTDATSAQDRVKTYTVAPVGSP